MAEFKSKKESPLCKKIGSKTFLSVEDESIVVDWVIRTSILGFPITRKELRESVQLSLNRQNKTTGFKDNLPFDGWLNRFIERHRLSLRKPENLELSKAQVTE